LKVRSGRIGNGRMTRETTHTTEEPGKASLPPGGDTVPCTLREFLFYFLRLGTFGFGGPIALAGYMQRDLVENRHWISKQDYVEGLALAQLAPGPLAAQLAIYLGWVRAGSLLRREWSDLLCKEVSTGTSAERKPVAGLGRYALTSAIGGTAVLAQLLVVNCIVQCVSTLLKTTELSCAR